MIIRYFVPWPNKCGGSFISSQYFDTHIIITTLILEIKPQGTELLGFVAKRESEWSWKKIFS
jgi:hypothetical protein